MGVTADPYSHHSASQSVMLQIAATELEKEESRRESEKQNYLSEHCPPLHIPGSMSEVQVVPSCHIPPKVLLPPYSSAGQAWVRAGRGKWSSSVRVATHPLLDHPGTLQATACKD